MKYLIEWKESIKRKQEQGKDRFEILLA